MRSSMKGHCWRTRPSHQLHSQIGRSHGPSPAGSTRDRPGTAPGMSRERAGTNPGSTRDDLVPTRERAGNEPGSSLHTRT